MATERRIDNGKRVRFFDGLFLKAKDFTLEQDFHTVARRYLNYLLFSPGRLLCPAAGSDEPLPLHVQANADGTEITVSAGSAMICDESTKQAYEVRLERNESFERSEIQVPDDAGSGTRDIESGEMISVLLAFRQVDGESPDSTASSVGSGGAGVLVSQADRLVEQAVIKFVLGDVIVDDEPCIQLATVTFGDPLAISNAPDIGGLRYEILSGDMRARIEGIAPVPEPEFGFYHGGNFSPSSINFGPDETLSICCANFLLGRADQRSIRIGDWSLTDSQVADVVDWPEGPGITNVALPVDMPAPTEGIEVYVILGNQSGERTSTSTLIIYPS